MPYLLLLLILTSLVLFNYEEILHLVHFHNSSATKGHGVQKGRVFMQSHAPLSKVGLLPAGESPLELAGKEFHRLFEEHRSLQTDVLLGKVPLSKCLIFRCSVELEHCGGVGDRFYGILVLYLGAILTKRPFFIYSIKPKPMEDYLEPNEFDWQISSLQNAESRRKALDCAKGRGRVFSRCVMHEIQIPYKTCSFLRKVLYSGDYFLNINDNYRTDCIEEFLRQLDSLKSVGSAGKEMARALREFSVNVSRFMLRALFRPHKHILTAAASILNMPVGQLPELDDCLLCVHVRTGSGLSEKARHTNLTMFANCAAAVEQRLLADVGQKCSGGKPRWFLAGDSESALDTLQQLSSVEVGDRLFIRTKQLGSVSHIDADHNASIGMSHAYVDWYLLSKCRYLVASLSTMGATAAIYAGSSVHRYDVEVANHTGSCRQSRISDWQRDANAG